ncbi:NACHT domain-containing protein [Dactylosporangium sp. NPDC000521]|uniref:NACHT domain-containing protein n=1 Tax=Dactylosporangium sp. NPDC000521 TaxID=3363975 RepID=UPI0036A85E25
MRRAWANVIGALVLLGIPAVLAARWQGLVERHPLAAFLLALGWAAVLAVAALLGRALAQPLQRRLEALGEALDRAFGRGLSGYQREYRRWVMSSMRYMDSKGLATVGEFTPELDEVFVDVSLAPRTPQDIPAGLLADGPGEAPLTGTPRMSIWGFIDGDGATVLAVIGGPGSGKTTLLRHVALRVAQAAAASRPVPVLLELRDHAERIAADARLTLPELVRGSVPAEIVEPPGWWEHRLGRGSCVILLDGLDEVPRTTDRARVVAWVNHQIAIYPDNVFVITSRPHGYRSVVIDAAQVLHVRPFTYEQVTRFLQGWYLATERRATAEDGPDTRLRARQAAKDLLDRLASAPALHDLTTNPLLLTMIANVHRYRGSLPGSRVDLYGEVCQVMLWRRQEAKRQPLELAGPRKERLLALLAFEMMRQQRRNLPMDEVLAIVRAPLARMSTTLEPDGFLADVGSNGLLVERERDTYAFAHLTFQEYLASRHILYNNLDDVLVANVDDPWWLETTLLRMAGSNADRIAQACLASGTTAALSLAFACAETSAEITAELRGQLDAVVSSAFAPDASADRRQLVASVLVARYLHGFVAIEDGGRICVRPVPGSLYLLFLRDTQAPDPDGLCIANASAPLPVTGVWASDAALFVGWVNGLATAEGGSQYRLPTMAELDQLLAGDGAAARALRRDVRCAWALPEPQASAPVRWTTTEQDALDQVRGSDVEAAVTLPIDGTGLVPQLLSLSLLLCVSAVRRLLDRALRPAAARLSRLQQQVGALRSEPYLEEPTGAGDFPLRAREINDARSRNTSLRLQLEQQLGLAGAVAQAISTAEEAVDRLVDHLRSIQSGFVHVVDAARERAVAHELERLTRLAADVVAAVTEAGDLDRVPRLVGERERTAEQATRLRDAASAARESRSAAQRLLAAVAGGTRVPLHDALHRERIVAACRSVEQPASVPSVDAWEDTLVVLRDAVGWAFAQAVDAVWAGMGDGTAPRRFAQGLTRSAGIAPEDGLALEVDGLAATARAVVAEFTRIHPAGSWQRAFAVTVASVAIPVLTRRAPADGARTAESVAVLLALAADAATSDRRQLREETLRIAAGLTLMRRRAADPERLEHLILAYG